MKLGAAGSQGGFGYICWCVLIDGSTHHSRLDSLKNAGGIGTESSGCGCLYWHAGWCRPHIKSDEWCHCISATRPAAEQISKTLPEI